MIVFPSLSNYQHMFSVAANVCKTIRIKKIERTNNGQMLQLIAHYTMYTTYIQHSHISRKKLTGAERVRLLMQNCHRNQIKSLNNIKATSNTSITSCYGRYSKSNSYLNGVEHNRWTVIAMKNHCDSKNPKNALNPKSHQSVNWTTT